MFASTWIYLSKFSKVIRPMQRKVCQVTLFFCNMIYWIVLGKLTWIKRLRLQKSSEFPWEWKGEMTILHIVTFITHFNSGWGTCYFTGLIQIRHSLGLLVVQKDDNPLVIAQTLWVCLEHCKWSMIIDQWRTTNALYIYLHNYSFQHSLKFRDVFWPLSVPFLLHSQAGSTSRVPHQWYISPFLCNLTFYQNCPDSRFFFFFLSDPNTINISP